MVLPLIVFEILIAVAVILFLFGASRESMNSGFIFLTLSALFILITGMFLTQGGLELNTVASYTNNPDGSTSVIMNVMQATNGTPIWALSQLFMYGGIGLIVLNFVLTVRQRRQTNRQIEQEYYNSV